MVQQRQQAPAQHHAAVLSSQPAAAAAGAGEPGHGLQHGALAGIAFQLRGQSRPQ